MPAAISAAITCTSLTFAWPDGTVAIDGLDLAVGPGRVGPGRRATASGKSTLLRLIAGELRPTGGTDRGDRRGRLPPPGPHPRRRRSAVPEFLRHRRGPSAPSGPSSPARSTSATSTSIGDDWDIEQRAVAELGRLGLPPDVLDRRMGELSGGEVVQLGLTRAAAAPAGRAAPRRADQQPRRAPPASASTTSSTSWRRTLLVVSHDRELLERVDRIGDLRDGSGPVVRRRLHGVRRAGGRRAGGRPAGRHHREGRPAQAAARPGRRRTRAGQPAEVREEERGARCPRFWRA